MSIEAMKQALEALETLVEMTGTDIYRDAKKALRQAIATEESSATQEPVWYQKEDGVWKSKRQQPKATQDPVAYVTGVYAGRFTYAPIKSSTVLPVGTSFYTQPKREPCELREWVGLTDDEIDNINYTSVYMLAKEVEAKLKAKNFAKEKNT